MNARKKEDIDEEMTFQPSSTYEPENSIKSEMVYVTCSFNLILRFFRGWSIIKASKEDKDKKKTTMLA